MRVRVKVSVSILVFFLVPFLPLLAQEEGGGRRGSRVIDDTTRSVYGPRTSRYFYEEDVFFNREKLHFVDTAIRNFHHFNDVQRYDNMLQDLGVIGTDSRQIFYRAPEIIGVTPGFQNYDAVWDREAIRYWDTKSTYTNMNVILGGRGRSITRATYSRNINPRWNFGFTYRGMFIDKQISRQGKGDRLVISHYYDAYTTYQNKDSTYRVFVNFRRNNHQVNLYGGVRADLFDPFPYNEFFAVDAQPRLNNANSAELRGNIHLYHQYAPGRGLQIYHRLDRFRQVNGFTNTPGRERDFTFDWVEIDSTETLDQTRFSSLRNEVGIKGSLSKLFYNGFIAQRNYRMSYPYDTLLEGQSFQFRRGTENYIGGRIALDLDSLLSVTGVAELLVQTGNYRIEGTLRSKWLDATLRQVQYEPSFMQQYYRGAHDFWRNNFSSTNSTQLDGSAHLKTKWLELSPGLTFTRIGNYVFFRSDSVKGRTSTDFPREVDVYPVQSSGEQIIFSPKLRAGLTILKHIHLNGFAVYSRLLQESDNAIQLPELFVNGQISYMNIFFNGNFDIHTGVDVHWQSSYNALAFDVPTRQFYVQGPAPSAPVYEYLYESQRPDNRLDGRPAFRVPSFPLVDVFLNAKIKRGRIFFRYNNLLQALTGEGYFVTPLYPGQRNSFDFGFDWSFYD